MRLSSRFLLLLAAVALGVAALASVALVVLPGRGIVATQPSSVGGPFRLVDHNGRTVTEADFAGRPFLVFFGFTHCPDICPTTLFEISETLNRLGPAADGAAALFITVDPARDTPERLKQYVSSFHPRIYGLTGTQDEIDAVVNAYRAYAKKVPLEGGDYTMDHTAFVYLFDRDGRFVAPFNLRRGFDAAAADLRRYL
jgi:protein SCO1/2